MHVRSVQLFERVARETRNRLVVKVFPNNVLGADPSLIAQLREGAIEMMWLASGSGTGAVPAINITQIGFAFPSEGSANAALDGAFGDAVGNEIEDKGFTLVTKATFQPGLRQMTSSVRPIRTPADLSGLKIRVQTARPTIDLFRTLGASPTPLSFADVYTGLQTHLIDGAEMPLSLIEVARMFEVQHYLGITNHTWSGYWLTSNPSAWKALGPELQGVVRRLAPEYVRLMRRDIAIQGPTLIDKLERQGMLSSRGDTAAFRAPLGPYYARWKAEFGPRLWGALEGASGKLG